MADNTKLLSVDELVRAELAVKEQAIKAYDDILWKIRASYATALYGGLTFFLGKGGLNLATVFAIAVAYTVAFFVIDINISVGRMRLIIIKDELANFIVDRSVLHTIVLHTAALGQNPVLGPEQKRQLRCLLRDAREGDAHFEQVLGKFLPWGVAAQVYLYLYPPILFAVVYFLIDSWGISLFSIGLMFAVLPLLFVGVALLLVALGLLSVALRWLASRERIRPKIEWYKRRVQEKRVLLR